MIVETEAPSNVAEMLQYPLDIAVAMPILLGSLLIVTIDGSDEIYAAKAVTFCTELSE